MKWCAALLLAGLLAAQSAGAHDSWIAQPGHIVTGSRYPAVDLTVPGAAIAAARCDDGACWAELKEFEIELDPRLVEVYFRELKPSEAVRARWKALQARGLPWRERYRKFVRSGTGSVPAGLDLEIVALGSGRFVLLSKGEPVKDQPIELLSDRSPLGVWSRTDARGEVEWAIPFPAQWLVRTIVIEPDGQEQWRSRFATLVFNSQPASR